MRKLLLLLPLLLIAGCAGKPKLTCKVEMDTRDTFDGDTVELEVSREAKPGRAGYGRLHTDRYSYWLSVDLPYVMGSQTAAKLTDGRIALHVLLAPCARALDGQANALGLNVDQL